MSPASVEYRTVSDAVLLGKTPSEAVQAAGLDNAATPTSQAAAASTQAALPQAPLGTAPGHSSNGRVHMAAPPLIGNSGSDGSNRAHMHWHWQCCCVARLIGRVLCLSADLRRAVSSSSAVLVQAGSPSLPLFLWLPTTPLHRTLRTISRLLAAAIGAKWHGLLRLWLVWPVPRTSS